MIYIDPSLEHAKREIDTVESYASNCSDFSLSTLYEALDIFAFAHFWGWLWVQIRGFIWSIDYIVYMGRPHMFPISFKSEKRV